MEYDALQEQVFAHLKVHDYSAAEQLLVETKDQFSGKALGRWYWLMSGVIRRGRPNDHKGFLEVCASASRLLQSDHDGLCNVYLTEMGAAIEWKDWNLARVYIRRLRALFRRYPDKYEIQRLQGAVLVNEGMVEQMNGQFARGALLYLQGIQYLDRYLYVDEATRINIMAASRLEAVDCLLRDGQKGKALEVLSRVDPDHLTPRDRNLYCYTHSHFWLSLGVLNRAEEWLNQIDPAMNWTSDAQARLLELRARIAMSRSQNAYARELLDQALQLTAESNYPALVARLKDQRLAVAEGR